MIVDANESWGALDIAAEAAALAALGVEMIEQPVPVGQDALLEKYRSPEPVEGRFSAKRSFDRLRATVWFGSSDPCR